MSTVLRASMSEIAQLARVRREVVSVWRSRHAQSGQPFPAPVASESGQDRFDVTEVARWLADTGRGNNPDAVADAAAYAVPGPDVDLRTPRLQDGLAALLALLHLTEGELVASTEPAAAAQYDPDDAFLAAEVRGLGPDRAAVRDYADRLSEAAFGPAPAMERLLVMPGSPRPSTRLSAQASELLVGLLAALLPAGDRPTLVDVLGSELALRLAQSRAGELDVVLAEPATRERRMLHRRLVAHDVQVRVEAGPAADVHFLHVPVIAEGPAVLDLIDDIALGLKDQQRAVVLAPAALLTDVLGDQRLDAVRAGVLRTGTVRAIVRLPAGHVPDRSREALAVWVLGLDPDGVPANERRIAVVDLSNERLAPRNTAQVRADVLAAMAPADLARRRSFAVARLLPTSRLLGARGSLVQPRLETPGAGADVAGEVSRLRRDKRSGVDVLADLELAQASAQPLVPVTVEEALRRDWLRAVPGNRLDVEVANDPAGAPAIGMAELTGHAPVGSRTVDRLTFLGGHPAARLTLAGDVVFSTAPPAAWVDPLGGSVVQSPARMLRIRPEQSSGLAPAVIAGAITRQPLYARVWRRWILPRLPEGQQEPLARALIDVADERAALRRRLDELDRLEQMLLDGVAAGAIALHHRPDAPPDKET